MGVPSEMPKSPKNKMPRQLEVNAQFLRNVFKLHRMFRDTNVAEVRIIADQISFYNSQSEPVDLSISMDISTNPFTRALNSYFEDLRCSGLPTHPPEEVLGKCLEEMAWGDLVRERLQEKFTETPPVQTIPNVNNNNNLVMQETLQALLALINNSTTENNQEDQASYIGIYEVQNQDDTAGLGETEELLIPDIDVVMED
ncbi:719_t:CDS:2, partial [Scutellospora calospora]